MTDWNYGYITNVDYPTQFHRETTPTWLAMVAVFCGQRPPDLSRPFRYADLGCGPGFTAVSVAAACANAEVWGFDVNPGHVETARQLAGRSGLGNATFVEASFADLARRPDSELPEFDFIVAHGVLSWVSPENRRHLIDLIGRWLRPGGLAYLGYNTMTGWASMVPVRALMRMLTVGRRDLAIPAILDVLDRIKQAEPAYFRLHQPSLDRLLGHIRDEDARYLAHEYLNEYWHPLMFADVADEMDAARCTYIGSATLSDNMDAISQPAGMLPLLAEAQDLSVKETLRDIGRAQMFRRDLFRRGRAPLLPGEHQALVDELSIVGLGAPVGDEVTIDIPSATLKGRPEIYRPLLRLLDNGPLNVAEVQRSEGLVGRPLAEVVQTVALLVAGGYALPRLPQGASAAARGTARALNLAIAEINASGGELSRLAAPAVGTAIPVAMLETFIVEPLLAGRPSDTEALIEHVLTRLARCSVEVKQDGQPVTEPEAAQRIVAEGVRNTLDRRVPAFRQLGILDG